MKELNKRFLGVCLVFILFIFEGMIITEVFEMLSEADSFTNKVGLIIGIFSILLYLYMNLIIFNKMISKKIKDIILMTNKNNSDISIRVYGKYNQINGEWESLGPATIKDFWSKRVIYKYLDENYPTWTYYETQK